MDLYFKRHDGQAVATDDFYAAMEDANQTDLSPFKRWYSQAGTPVLAVSTKYHTERKEFVIKCSQSCVDTPHQTDKKPFLIPVKFALVDSAGNDMPINCANPACITVGDDNILKISAAEQEFIFADLSEKPVVSLLREFSAPINLSVERTDKELGFLLANDNDSFSRWEAGQDLMSNALMKAMRVSDGLSPVQYDQAIPEALGSLLEQHRVDQAFVAEALMLPSEAYLAEKMDIIDVDLIHHVCRSLVKHIASSLKEPLLAIVSEYRHHAPYSIDAKSFGIRKLKNQALALLMSLEEASIDKICYSQFTDADNMTDQYSALACLANSENEYRLQALDEFYHQWHHDPLVMDKWLMVQASSRLPNTLTAVRKLASHSVFNYRNPNKVRALVGVFCHQNPINFHNKDGSGYQFLAEHVTRLEKINSRIAAGLLKALTRWRRYDKTRQEMMQAVLQQVLNLEGLSTDCFEIANKSLE